MTLTKITIPVLLLFACAPKPPLVETKVFVLNPKEYFDKTVQLKGKLAAMGPAGSFIVFEDASGKVLLTTEKLGTPIACKEGSSLAVLGTLKRFGQTAFMTMDSLQKCGL